MNIFIKRTLAVLTTLFIFSGNIFSQTLENYDFNGEREKVFGYVSEFTQDGFRINGVNYAGRVEKGNKVEAYYFAENPYILTGKTGSREYRFLNDYRTNSGKVFHNVLTPLYEDTLSYEDNEYERYFVIDENNPNISIAENYNYSIRKDEIYTAHQEFDSENRMTHVKVEKEVEDDPNKEFYIEIWVTYHANGKIASYIDSDGQIYKFNEEEKPLYIKYSDGSEIWFKYNAKGLEDTKKFSDGNSYKNVYNKKLVLTKRVWKDGAENIFEYDKEGKLSHQYTTFPNIADKLDEITYTYLTYPDDRDCYSCYIEKHSDGETYYVTNDKVYCTYSKIKEVKGVNPVKKTIFTLPDELYTENSPKSYVPYYEDEDIYLFPEDGYRSEGRSGYIFTSNHLIQENIGRYCTLSGYTEADYEGILKEGDFYFIQGSIYYKKLNNYVDTTEWYSKFVDTLPDDYRTLNAFRTALYSDCYVVPKGLIFAYSSRNDSCPGIFGIELDGIEPVKVITEENLNDWLKDQKGNFTFKKYINYRSDYIIYSVYKDGKDISKRNTYSLKKYSHGPNIYSGTLNDQYDIYHFLDNTYCIVSNCGILEGYIEFPEDKEGVSTNICFDKKGNMYGVISPEYIKTWGKGEDPEAFYAMKEGTHGEIVKYSGYLTNFGYLNDDKIRLRKYPTTSSASLGTYPINTTFRILTETTKEETIGSETGIWYKVRLTDGTEGYFFGPFVSRFE